MQGSEVMREVQPLPQAARANDPERFVDSVAAAKFLSIQRRLLLQLAREGKLPAYPIGDGQRRLWRFRLSDLAKVMEERMIYGKSTGSIPKTRQIVERRTKSKFSAG